ncbi:glycoside hydrolase family 3 N-terminal domain-containing protein [Murimonas intestini]|uniref:glycoside hydrolase family 3 N-terminal domain-containing protein n=1 Tax=Murimonas intestini TaxID=1337051 RepID=UPI0016527418|nr:glycoside hydrolase family 3 N-terminal domain-containing protein [Murimonas intestini]
MTIKDRVEELLSKMTLREKIGQLNQAGTTMNCTLPGFEADIDTWVSQMLQGRLSKEELDRRLAMCEEDLREDEIAAGELGNYVNLYDDEKIARGTKAARENSRLGIPMFVGVDVIRGYRTIFPTPLALSCSWDMDAVRRSTQTAKREAWVSGVNWTFGPMLDIARDARWGRIVESPGEDPYLAGEIAKVQVREFQREEEDGCRLMASAKHFLAYGAVSGGQDYYTVDMSERQLFETYLPPFKAAVDAGAGAVMSAFHDLNGIPCTMDKWLLTDILRGKLGFEGFVVSDAEAVKQCAVHGAVKDEKEAAKMSLLAGGDMDMSSLDYIQYLEELVEEGEIEEEDVDRAVRRVLTKKFEFGLFDKEWAYDPKRICDTVLSPENRKTALDVGKRCAVLLKNDGILPITKGVKKILITGELADDRQALMGPWSFTGRTDTQVTIVDGMKNYAPEGVEITYIKGFGVKGGRDGFEEAYEMAKKADMVIAVAGEEAYMSGEAASRADLHLAGLQEEFLLGLAELKIPVAVVLINGRPLAVRCLQDCPGIGAILEGWHLGTEFGNAVAEILYGKYNPSGKLTVTFANEGGQEPMYYNHPNTGKPGSDFKFTSKYQDVPFTPLYPFGYGLSYTVFAYDSLKLEKEVLEQDESLCCSVKVTNTGSRAGEEVVQLYIRDMAGSCVRPVRELKAFRKIMLKPGEEKEISFQVPVKDMGFYNRSCQYIVEPGEFRVFVGPDSVSGLSAAYYIR